MTSKANDIASFLLPWALLLIIGLIGSKYLHSSLKYFSIALSITSIITLIGLWWTGSYRKIHSTNALLSALVIISLKMFVSGIIFIYYFHHNRVNAFPAFALNFLLFALYTCLEVYVGMRYSNSSNLKEAEDILKQGTQKK